MLDCLLLALVSSEIMEEGQRRGFNLELRDWTCIYLSMMLMESSSLLLLAMARMMTLDLLELLVLNSNSIGETCILG